LNPAFPVAAATTRERERASFRQYASVRQANHQTLLHPAHSEGPTHPGFDFR
jgi:hypothetical protein